MMVTLEEAKAHVYVYHNDDDALIEIYRKAAEAAVKTYLQGFDFDTLEPLPEQFKLACLLLIGNSYKNREGQVENQVDKQFGYGYLPQAVTSLLYPFKHQGF
jgi:uncharacterized phage protein (predicted DNA packaging)